MEKSNKYRVTFISNSGFHKVFLIDKSDLEKLRVKRLDKKAKQKKIL